MLRKKALHHRRVRELSLCSVTRELFLYGSASAKALQCPSVDVPTEILPKRAVQHRSALSCVAVWSPVKRFAGGIVRVIGRQTEVEHHPTPTHVVGSRLTPNVSFACRRQNARGIRVAVESSPVRIV